MILTVMAPRLLPSNARRSAHNSYRMQPNPQPYARARLITLTVIAPRLLPSNARRSAHSSYRMQPSAQTSVALPYGRPCAGMPFAAMQMCLCLSEYSCLCHDKSLHTLDNTGEKARLADLRAHVVGRAQHGARCCLIWRQYLRCERP